jgi:hypothetical protein
MSTATQKRIEGPLEDGRVGSRIENYTAFWKKDTANETEGDNANRLAEYTDVVNGASRLPAPASPCPAHIGPQDTTTARQSCTSTAGRSPSTSRASTRARRSPPRSRGTSTISPRR